jgi:hypothetical protein
MKVSHLFWFCLRPVQLPTLRSSPILSALDIEHLTQLSDGLIMCCDGVSDGSGVLVDFVIVAALEALVAEEVDGGVVNTSGLVFLCGEVLEAVCLVPALWEDVKGDLSADREAMSPVSTDLLSVCLTRSACPSKPLTSNPGRGIPS